MTELFSEIFERQKKSVVNKNYCRRCDKPVEGEVLTLVKCLGCGAEIKIKPGYQARPMMKNRQFLSQ